MKTISSITAQLLASKDVEAALHVLEDHAPGGIEPKGPVMPAAYPSRYWIINAGAGGFDPVFPTDIAFQAVGGGLFLP